MSWVVDRIEGGQVIVEDGEDFFEVPVATWGSACFFEGLVLVDGRPSPQQALQRYSEGWARLERLRSRSEAGSAGMWSASTVAMDGAGADKGLERP